MSRRKGLVGRLLLEGVVIVGSILLAFALDTWWSNRRERADELAVLENLEQEFRSAGEQLDVYIALHQRIAHAIGLTVEAAQVAIANGDSTIVVPDTALTLAFIGPTFDPRLGTLEGLLSAGRLHSSGCFPTR